jgi:hypothetical protein
MGDVLTFTNPKWARLAPIYAESCEINVIVVYDFLDWIVPLPAQKVDSAPKVVRAGGAALFAGR